MKNRVLRLALVVVLVMAMVLTMAACGDDTKPSPTPTPTPSTTPTTPTPTPTPSKTPDKPTSGTDENETIAKQFGVTVEDFKGTFGDEDMDIVIKADAALSADEQYDVYLRLSGSPVKYLNISDGKVYDANFENEAAINGETVDVSYDGDNGTIATLPIAYADSKLTIATTLAGLYEFELEFTVVDKAAEYGAWLGEKENLEFTLTATSEVAKKALEISTDPIVIKEGTGELTVAAGVVKEGSNPFSTFTTNYEASDITDGTTTVDGVQYTLNFTKEAKVGEYSVKVEFIKSSEVVDIEDVLWKNYEATLKDTKVYVVSAYDWNEIRDVVTSVTEINNDFTANISTQHPLAKARYDALTDAQKAFFKTGIVKQVGGDMEDAYILAWEGGLATSIESGTDLAEFQASTVKAYMDKAETAAKEDAIVKAFNKAVNDSKLPTYQSADGTTIKFDVKNSAAMAAFGTVDTYFKALSEDDQKVVSTKNSDEYKIYKLAEGAISLKDIAAVQELIAGAYNAYIKALDNSKIVYQATDWAYINNSEVKALTSQAKTAYDKLTADQQKALSTDANRIPNRTESLPGTKGTVTVSPAGDFKVALTKLTDMNEMISYMEKIIGYVNINDYSAITVPFERLNEVVYGKADTNANFESTNYAMKDLINAPSRNYDAIITEYQAWIDYVLAIEDFKANLVEEFKKLVTTEYTENAADYAEATVANALNFDNNKMKEIVKAITDEDSTKGYIASKFFTKIDKDEVLTFEELKEAWDGIVDLDAALTVYTTEFAPLP